jgi:hypothetical protein
MKALSLRIFLVSSVHSSSLMRAFHELKGIRCDIQVYSA